MRTDFVPGAIFFLIGAAPTALLVWFVMARASRREAAHAAMLGEAGVQPGSGCDHSEGGTGIAINKQAKTVTMLVAGVSKTYPFADIREWRSAKHTAGQVVGVGIQGGLAAVGANAAAERQAKAASGFFVSVRDVDHPTWRIEMKNEPTQHRWMELFTQEINEK
jgi:hypothetical protein